MSHCRMNNAILFCSFGLRSVHALLCTLDISENTLYVTAQYPVLIYSRRRISALILYAKSSVL